MNKDQWMIQGDLYKTGRQDPVAYPAAQPSVDRMQAHTDYNGGYLQARWTRTSSTGSESEVQFSYDRNNIDYPYFGGTLQNLTFDFQRRVQTGERNEIYWGAGFQQYSDDTYSNRYIGFNPSYFCFSFRRRGPARRMAGSTGAPHGVRRNPHRLQFLSRH